MTSMISVAEIFGEREVDSREKSFVIDGAQHDVRQAREGRVLVSADEDDGRASVFGCAQDALESLGLARIRDQRQQHIVLAHGEGERGRALSVMVLFATQRMPSWPNLMAASMATAFVLPTAANMTSPARRNRSTTRRSVSGRAHRASPRSRAAWRA